MRLVVGLGNPGNEYLMTKHNVGFMVIDKVAMKLNLPEFSSNFKGLYYKGKSKNGFDYILLKPQTYMNNSGESVQALAHYFKIQVEDILVISDDLDLPLGKLRLRFKCDSGGHNGIKSIFTHLGSEDFKRMRIGIDKDKNYSVVDYVLSRFNSEEQEIIKPTIIKASEVVEDFVDGMDFDKIMNKYNVK